MTSSLAGVPVTVGDSPGATAVPTTAISSCLVLISSSDSGPPISVAFNSTPTTSPAGNVAAPSSTLITKPNGESSSQAGTVTLASPQTLTTFMATVYPTSSGKYVTVYPSDISGNSTTIPICGEPPLDVGGTNTIATSSGSSDSSQATGTKLQANDGGDNKVGSSAGILELSIEGMILSAFTALGMAAL